MNRSISPAGIAALGGLAGLVVISVGWWALALWPAPDAVPGWVLRARAVCFNAGSDGLPDASGWLLLIGQPVGMFAVLMAIAGPAVREGLAWVRSSFAGRWSLASTGLALAVGLVAATARVASARPADQVLFAADEPVSATYPRLDREAPALSLVDQSGREASLDRFRGTPVLMTFAFGHCEEICPAVVHQVAEAQRRLAGTGTEVAVVVVTLDPWRDTPARLPYIAERWGLTSPTGLVLSGPVDQVSQTLDAWNVARTRDPRTGDVAHPALVYVIDAYGRLAYAANGGTSMYVELVGRL